MVYDNPGSTGGTGIGGGRGAGSYFPDRSYPRPPGSGAAPAPKRKKGKKSYNTGYRPIIRPQSDPDPEPEGPRVIIALPRGRGGGDRVPLPSIINDGNPASSSARPPSHSPPSSPLGTPFDWVDDYDMERPSKEPRLSGAGPSRSGGEEPWYRDVEGSKGAHPARRESGSSVPFGPPRPSSVRSPAEPPRGPRAMVTDGYVHSNCQEIIYRLRNQLVEANEKVKTLEKPVITPRALPIGPDGWAIDIDTQAVPPPADRLVELERENELKEKIRQLEEDNAGLRKDKAEKDRWISSRNTYIAEITKELEQARVKLQEAECRAGSASSSNQRAPAPGQLELAQSQIAKYKAKETRWDLEKVQLQAEVSREQTRARVLMAEASTSTNAIEEQKRKIDNQKTQINSLLHKRKDDDTGATVNRDGGRGRDNAERQALMRDMERNRDEMYRLREDLKKAQNELGRTRDMLERERGTGTGLQADVDRLTSKAREETERVAKMSEEWKVERDQLQAQALEGWDLLKKADEERIEREEELTREKDQELARRVEKLRFTETNLQHTIDSTRTDLDAARARCDAAEQEVQRLKEMERARIQSDQSRSTQKHQELVEMVEKLQSSESDLQSKLDVMRSELNDAQARTEVAEQEIQRLEEIEEERTRLEVTVPDSEVDINMDVEIEALKWEAEKKSLEETIKYLRIAIEKFESEVKGFKLDKEKSEQQVKDLEFNLSCKQIDIDSTERLNFDLLCQLKYFQGWDSETQMPRVGYTRRGYVYQSGVDPKIYHG